MNNERILVVKRATLFADTQAWQGINAQDLEKYALLVEREQEFHQRMLMETDQRYKQIIPYLVFTYSDKYFLMQRAQGASEKRLQNKYSLGIGGHIRQEDMLHGSIFEWAQREFHEEVSYNGQLTITPLGVLNDDTNDVGKVHMGFVLLLEGTSADIAIKSELKSGQLLTLAELEPYVAQMEQWSAMVYALLKDDMQSRAG